MDDVLDKVAELRSLGLRVIGLQLSREYFTKLGLRGKTFLGVRYKVGGRHPFRVIVEGGRKAEEDARWCASIGIRYRSE